MTEVLTKTRWTSEKKAFSMIDTSSSVDEVNPRNAADKRSRDWWENCEHMVASAAASRDVAILEINEYFEQPSSDKQQFLLHLASCPQFPEASVFIYLHSWRLSQYRSTSFQMMFLELSWTYSHIRLRCIASKLYYLLAFIHGAASYLPLHSQFEY